MRSTVPPSAAVAGVAVWLNVVPASPIAPAVMAGAVSSRAEASAAMSRAGRCRVRIMVATLSHHGDDDNHSQ